MTDNVKTFYRDTRFDDKELWITSCEFDVILAEKEREEGRRKFHGRLHRARIDVDLESYDLDPTKFVYRSSHRCDANFVSPMTMILQKCDQDTKRFR